MQLWSGCSCGAVAGVVREWAIEQRGRRESYGIAIALAPRGLVVGSIILSFGVAVTVNVRVGASCCTWNPTKRLEGI